MVTALLVLIALLLAFCTGILIWKVCTKTEDKYDPKTHQALMDAVVAKEDLEQKIREKVQSLTGKTRRYVEEDMERTMGKDGFRRFMRG